MWQPLLAILLPLIALTLFGCSGDDGSDGASGAPPSSSQTSGSDAGPTTLQFVVTNDASQTDLEDEELSPILQEIEPQIENRLANSAVPSADVQFIAPRSIVIQVEGEADIIQPQIQQIIDDGNFEIPLTVTLLAPQ